MIYYSIRFILLNFNKVTSCLLSTEKKKPEELCAGSGVTSARDINQQEMVTTNFKTTPLFHSSVCMVPGQGPKFPKGPMGTWVKLVWW